MKPYPTLLFLIGSLCAFANASARKPDRPTAPSERADRTAAHSKRLAEAGLLFTENRGQVADDKGKPRPDVLFTAGRGGTKVFLTATGIHYQFERVTYPAGYKHGRREGNEDGESQKKLEKVVKRETHRFTLALEGANPAPMVRREARKAFYENFYLAHCPDGITNVPTFERVVLVDVYPGIDWVVYSHGQRMKYDFIVHPGADASRIKLRVKDADARIADDGSLVMKTSLGEVREASPTSSCDGEAIETKFSLTEDGTLSFELEGWDSTKPLIIDPTVDWGTYYGGSSTDQGHGSCATDASNNVYLTGYTFSTSGIASGGFQNSYAGGPGPDAFLVKFNTSGGRLWATYYGGSDDEWMTACASDGTNVFLSGVTRSTSAIASGGFQNFNAGDEDVFLVKFNSAGARQWATFYGGAGSEEDVTNCATDASGNVYLTGTTGSTSGIASGGFQNGLAGARDAFLVKFSGSGSRLWATYYGGSGDENSGNCATDASGNIYLAGTTASTSGIASGGFQNTSGGGGNDNFLVKFNSGGSRLWATFYGGSGSDYSPSCETDASGNVFLSGATLSTSGIASGGFQNTSAGAADAFLVKFNSGGGRLWATYYGGSAADVGTRCAADAAGNVYLTGFTLSTAGIASGGFQNTNGGGNDAFIVKFNSDGSRLWASYRGGSGSEVFIGCAVDANGNTYISGHTSSTSGIASGGFQNSIGGGIDAFLVKIEDPSITTGTITGSPFCQGEVISVPFTKVGTFNSTNDFTAQLSSSTGSFASPITIGTLNNTTTSGTITATIPAGAAAGTGYRIRVISNNPAVIGEDNGTNLTILNNVTPSVSISASPSTSISSPNTSITFTANPTNGGTPSYQWRKNNVIVGTNSPTYTDNVWAAGDQVTVRMTSTANCASPTQVFDTVTIQLITSVPPCNMANYAAIPLIPPSAFPYTSPTSGITINASLSGISTTSNASGSCGGNTYACSNPAWVLGNTAGQNITLTFSSPVNNFSFIMNGTNSGEAVTVTPLTGTPNFTNFCTASFSQTGPNTLTCSAATATGTLVKIFNSIPTTQFVITHNGAGAGSRITPLDCYSSSGQGPADVDTGIVLWLDGSNVDNNGFTANPANNASVSVWKDVSGNNNDASTVGGQNAGAMGTAQINGKDVVKFTRVNAGLGTVYNIPTLDIRAISKPKLTLFTVYRMGSNTLNQALWGNDNGNWDRFFYPIWSFNATDGAVGVGAPTNIVSIPSSGTIGDTKLLTAVFQNGATDSSVIYYNALPVDTFTDNSSPTAAINSFFVGWDGDGNPMTGDVAEVIAYDRKLTPCEIKAVNRYLAYKYGVTLTTATITQAGSGFVCPGGPATLTASAGTSYQWLLGNTIIPSATSQSYSTTTAGSYRVIVTANGCPDTSAATVLSAMPTTLYVDAGIAASGTGGTWGTAKKTLAEALVMANSVNCPIQIWVKGGTYRPTTAAGVVTTSRDSSFRILRNNIKVYGGFAGTESLLTQRTAAVMAANPTTLSGDIGVANDITDNSYHVMTIVGNTANNIDTTTVVDGFTITRGNANGGGVPLINGVFVFQSAGGGINCAGYGAGCKSSPLLENISFVQNSSTYGGGIYGEGHGSGKSSPTVRACTFTANRASHSGGGMHFYSDGSGGEVSPSFSSCTFQYNYATYLGGGGYGATAAPALCNMSLRNCTLDSNYNADTATASFGFYYGGALTISAPGSSPTIDNCSFTDNRSYFSGAIGSISLLNLTVDSSTFTGNKATYRGGAISFQDAGLTVTNSSFTANTGQTGGGIGVAGASALTISNCDFTADSATFVGGAIYQGSSVAAAVTDSRFINNWGTVVGAIDKPGSGNLSFTDCIFNGNKTAQLGGVINNFSGGTSFVNCVLANNSTTGTTNDGGGAIHVDAGGVTLLNSTLYNNTTASTAVPGGNAMSADAGSTVNVVNSIVWGAATTQVAGAGTINYSYSNVRGITPPANSISVDPSFVNISDLDGVDNTWATADDGLRLSPCSPSINTGSSGLVPPAITTDITGAARIQLGNVDMGAYEAPSAGSVLYVAGTVAASGNGSSWGTALKTVGEALAIANNSVCVDTIWVKAGTYYPTTAFGVSTTDRDSSFRILRNGIRLFGGFAGTEALLSQRNITANPTILSGDIGAQGVHTDNSYKVVTVLAAPGDVIDSNTIIDGFTIKRGYAAMATSTNITRYGQSYARWDAGGVLIVGSGATCSPTIQNCKIDSNDASFGTGIYVGSPGTELEFAL